MYMYIHFIQSKPAGNHYLVEPGVEKGFTGGVPGYVSFFSFFKALFAASRRFLNLEVEPAASPEARKKRTFSWITVLSSCFSQKYQNFEVGLLCFYVPSCDPPGWGQF